MIECRYLNMETKLLCLSDEILCKEVGHCGLTRAIPYFVDEDFRTLIAGGKKFTEEEAIDLFKDLTGIVIEDVRPPTITKHDDIESTGDKG